MSETKRFYWLKLQEDFFEDDTIDFIESQENGEKYCLFYLKLCLKALKSEGKLIRYVGNMLIPYDEKGLAKLTRTDVDTVRCALALFDKIGLITRLNTGEIFISQLNEMVGTETDKAKLMRQKRAKEKLISNNVTTMLPECYTEKELEKEKEQEKELKKDTEKEKKHKNGIYQNVLLSDIELIKLCEELGTEKAKAVIDNFSELKEMKGYKYKSDYLALKKWGIKAFEDKNTTQNTSQKSFDKSKLQDRDFFATNSRG
jgi:predicted phage replisome organizer